MTGDIFFYKVRKDVTRTHTEGIIILTDVSSENCLNLFLLELPLDDELTSPINGATAIEEI